MVLKLRDLLNTKFNKLNYQISFDIKKKEMKKFDLDIDDLLNINIIKKEKKFE